MTDQERARQIALAFSKKCEANAPTQMLVDNFAAALAEVRRETVKECIEIYQNAKRTHDYCMTPEKIVELMRRVGQPTELVWCGHLRQERHLKTNTSRPDYWVFLEPNYPEEGYAARYDASTHTWKSCPICGKLRPMETPQ